MKKFKFKLSTPLKIKQMKEEIEKQKLAESITKKNHELSRLNELKQEKLDTRENLKEALNSSTKITDLNDFGAYMVNLKSLVQKQQTVVAQAEELYELTRQSYIESRKEKEILEKLEEKSFQAYFRELDRVEQKISDESASLAYNRRKRDVPNGYI